MFPHIIPWSFRVPIRITALSHESGTRHILEITPPFYTGVIEDIDDRRDVFRDTDVTIVVEAEIIAGD
jgi:nucleoid-associated protein YgaU